MMRKDSFCRAVHLPSSVRQYVLALHEMPLGRLCRAPSRYCGIVHPAAAAIFCGMSVLSILPTKVSEPTPMANTGT